MSFVILQWNARSLIRNGQEFKKYVDDLSVKPSVICIQESWLISKLDFCIKGYSSVRRDRDNGRGGGVITFVQTGIQYREVKRGKQLEYVMIEVRIGTESIEIINFYNPCQQLLLNQLEEIWEGTKGRVLWCGDFNAHSTLWGDKNDCNGDIILEFMDGEDLVCLNDGSGTRMDMARGTESAIDLTLATATLADKCEWEVLNRDAVGSDHFPIRIEMGMEVSVEREIHNERWILEKADWNKFRQISEERLSYVNINANIEDFSLHVSAGIVSAATTAIPKTKPVSLGRIVPWWNKDCRMAVKNRNKAFRVLKRTHSFQNLVLFKKAQATVRRTVKQAKKDCWKRFCDSVGRDTPVGKVWGMIKKMKGNGKQYGYPGLLDGDTMITSNIGKAEIIAKTLSKVHSTDNLSQKERAARAETVWEYQQDCVGVDDDTGVTGGEMNTLFTIAELDNALRKLGKSSPGGDGICYTMLEKLTDKGKEVLLALYNKVWTEGIIPKAWKESIIIPIKKPGKDPHVPGNYRPIALTSQMGKAMEKMINDRMSYIIESKKLIQGYQSGFRRGRGAMDPLVVLEDEIRRAQANREAVVAVFFDIEKAYDMMWKEGLLIKLRTMGFNGRMFNWVREFLTGRSIIVKINGVLSQRYDTENGIPQGSIVSPMLFAIMINGIFSEIESHVEVALYADDGALWKRGRNIKFIWKEIQRAVTDVDKWAIKWGFRISVQKTKSMVFTKKKITEDMKITLSGLEVERVESFKYLGMWLDPKLTWNPHIQNMVERCKKVLNVMRCLRGIEWGASRHALRTIYTGLIRSVLDYGSFIYGSAAKTILRKLDVVQNQALRLCCGAMKSTPVTAIQVEMEDMPLHLRRDQLAAVYWANLKGHSTDHMSQSVLQPCQERLNLNIKSYGWTISDRVRDLSIHDLKISPTVFIPTKPPWVWEGVPTDLLLLEGKRDHELDKYQVQGYINERYGGEVKIFTDASKLDDRKVGVAFVIPELGVEMGRRITDDLAVYTAELIAVWLALQWVEENRPERAVIASDCSSALLSIKSWQSNSRQDVVSNIAQLSNVLLKAGVMISFVWVPAHIGVAGNELADSCAKKAASNTNVEMEVDYSKSEIKSIIKQKIRGRWQSLWDSAETGRHLHAIQSKIDKCRASNRSKGEEDIISRMRFGHTRLNSTLAIMKKHADGRCEFCDSPESVEHVICHCPRYQEERETLIKQLKRVKLGLNLKEILRKGSGHICFNYVLKFLKDTGLFHRV